MTGSTPVCPICRAPWNCVLEHTPHEPICVCVGAWTQTVHEINAEGHQTGCPRWGIRQRPGDLFGPPAEGRPPAPLGFRYFDSDGLELDPNWAAADEAAEVEDSGLAAVRELREVPHWPHRGSDVEAWLKASRDKIDPAWNSAARDVWNFLDDLLDEYRLRADTGSTLDAPLEELGPDPEPFIRYGESAADGGDRWP